MEQLIRLVKVDSKYIKYLYSFDKKVMYNKGQKRPYLGVLFEVRGHKYYAPLTHPKEKFKHMRNSEDFMRIKGGTLGAINFNNMIPVVDDAVSVIDVSQVEDIKYKMLLINQLRFFDDNDIDIINRATKLYKAYKSKKLRKAVFNRCCNFYVLEKKSKEYNPNFVPKNIKKDN